MEILTLLFLFLAGCVAGFLAGFFGVGGGLILVPVLLYYYQSISVSSLISMHLTLGTSLFVVIFASLASAFQYHQNHNVVWRAVLHIGIASIVGAFLGTSIAVALQGKTLRQIFAVVVVVASLRLFSQQGSSRSDAKPQVSAPALLGTGVAVGLVSSLAGVGGGVFSVPIMSSLLKFPLKKALGTSSATIVITALAATGGYVVNGWGNASLPSYTLGFVDFLHSSPIIVGTLLFGRIGAHAAHKTRAEMLAKVFAVFLLVIAFRMFFF